jgi:hypothetical protein
VTSAMESGLADHVWSLEEMCALLPEMASATKRHARIETTGNVYVQAIPDSVRSMVEADITDVLTPVVVN